MVPDEVAAYRRDGYCRGGAVATPSEMATVRARVDDCLASPVLAEHPDLHRHLDDRAIYELCAHPAIVERVASILGPDVVVWHSRVFHKRASDPPIPWHQDAAFWSLEPLVSVSAWISIDRADASNACVEVIPGSHHKPVTHLPATGTGRFGRQADLSQIDARGAVRIELDPGEFFLFDPFLLHSSTTNPSGRPRTALSIRYTTPAVTVNAEKLRPSVPGYGVQLVRGHDRERRNPLARPPARR